MDLMANCASACANHTSAFSGQNVGSFRATFVEAVEEEGKPALGVAMISGVSSTLGMSKKTKSLERAKKFLEEI